MAVIIIQVLNEIHWHLPAKRLSPPPFGAVIMIQVLHLPGVIAAAAERRRRRWQRVVDNPSDWPSIHRGNEVQWACPSQLTSGEQLYLSDLLHPKFE